MSDDDGTRRASTASTSIIQPPSSVGASETIITGSNSVMSVMYSRARSAASRAVSGGGPPRSSVLRRPVRSTIALHRSSGGRTVSTALWGHSGLEYLLLGLTFLFRGYLTAFARFLQRLQLSTGSCRIM